ncbi:MAG: hypothetical protein IE909_19315 [Campylobacterales bacterium]|nr:hypothetical protein [Campylobacterales bacterium]
MLYILIKNRSFKYKIKAIKLAKDKLVILGNGPSLKNDLQKVLSLEADFFCVNHFADHQYFEDIKPRYYLFLDPYFWSDGVNQEYRDKRETTFKNLSEKVSWELEIFIPSYTNKSIEEKINNKNIKVTRYSAVSTDNYPSFLENILLNTSFFSPLAINVVIHTIFISIHMGYKNIDVYGIDTSVFQGLSVDQMTNQVFVEFNHFYGTKRVVPDEAGQSKPLTMSQSLKKEYLNFQTYELISRFAAHKNVNLVNKSSFSLVDSIRRP